MYNYPEGCKILFYIKINAFIKWMDAACMLGTFYVFLLSLFLNQKNTLRVSNSLDLDQFNKLSGLIWTNVFCKDYTEKVIPILTH